MHKSAGNRRGDRLMGGYPPQGSGGATPDSIWTYPKRTMTAVYPSGTLQISADTERSTNSTSYIKVKEIALSVSGYIRTYFELRSSTNTILVFGRVYRNGTALGTERAASSTTYVAFTEDLLFNVGDMAQLYLRSSYDTHYAYARNFRLSFSFMETSGRVIMD